MTALKWPGCWALRMGGFCVLDRIGGLGAGVPDGAQYGYRVMVSRDIVGGGEMLQ